MQTKLNPYLSFKDTAKEAMEFYKTIFGGTLTMSTFKESNAPVPENEGNHIMHAMLVADNGITLMGADTPSTMGELIPGSAISISLSGDNEEELKGYWDKFSKKGAVIQPLSLAPWGDTFGMLTDKFGIKWMINILGKK